MRELNISPFGKRTRGILHRLGAPLKIVSLPCSYNCNESNNIVVAAVRSQSSIIKGQLGSKTTEIMMYSGSSISLVRESVVRELPCDKTQALPQGYN